MSQEKKKMKRTVTILDSDYVPARLRCERRAWPYLAEQEVDDVEDHAERELGREKGEEPLGRVHVSFQVQAAEVAVQVRQLLLEDEAGD